MGWQTLKKLSPSQRTNVRQHHEGVLFLEDRVGLVSWAEVEDTALAQAPDDPATEPFAGRPTFFEDDLVRFGDVKRLVVHLGVRDLELRREAMGDRVVGLQDSHGAGRAVVAVGGEAAIRQVQLAFVGPRVLADGRVWGQASVVLGEGVPPGWGTSLTST